LSLFFSRWISRILGMLAKLPFSTSLILLFPRPSLEIVQGTFNSRLIEIHNSIEQHTSFFKV